MRKILMINLFILMFISLGGCYVSLEDKYPIFEGTYTGEFSVYKADRKAPDYEIPYHGATGILVVKPISKSEYMIADGVNVLKDMSIHRVYDYYSVVFKMVFNDDRTPIDVVLHIKDDYCHGGTTVYDHQNGYLTVENYDLKISFHIGDYTSVVCRLYKN